MFIKNKIYVFYTEVETMLTSYENIDESTNVGNFMREVKEKKNFNYVILNTEPKSLVDLRTLSLKSHNPQEKLKNIKKSLSKTDSKSLSDLVSFFINSGERIIETPEGYYDFTNMLELILEDKPSFLDKKLQSEVIRDEIYALNLTDKITTARNFFIDKKINLLPVIDGMKVIGEVRTQDLLAIGLFDVESYNKDYYNPNKEESAFNMSIQNIMNSKPHTIQSKNTIKDALKLMIEKKLPALIVCNNFDLYSIISYSDILKMYFAGNQKNKFEIEIVGGDTLFEDEVYSIKKFAQRTMNKITKISDYDHLKITVKPIGNTQGTHRKKVELRFVLSQGKKIIAVDKEIVTGTSDENFNDKVKKNWNIPQMAQEAFDILEDKVKTEKNK